MAFASFNALALDSLLVLIWPFFLIIKTNINTIIKAAIKTIIIPAIAPPDNPFELSLENFQENKLYH